MSKSIGRQNEENAIIDKIQSVFDNAERIRQFHFEIDGGVTMATQITYEVTEVLVTEKNEEVEE